MYRNAYQHGLLTIFSSAGSRPLLVWGVHVKNGHISTNIDPDIKSQVVDVMGVNVSTTFITCPKNPKDSLAIHLPYLVMIIKNLHKYFSFEVTILDETETRRRFRVSNFQSTTTIHPFCTAMPIGLSGGWNQIQFNLAEFTRRAYKLQFAEVVRVQINANVRLRRIYFAERLYLENELPKEYKLFFPIRSKHKRPDRPVPVDKVASEDKENAEPLNEEPSKIASKKSLSLTKHASGKLSTLYGPDNQVYTKECHCASTPKTSQESIKNKDFIAKYSSRSVTQLTPHISNTPTRETSRLTMEESKNNLSKNNSTMLSKSKSGVAIERSLNEDVVILNEEDMNVVMSAITIHDEDHDSAGYKSERSLPLSKASLKSLTKVDEDVVGEAED